MKNLLALLLFAMSSTLFAQVPPIEPGVSQDLARWRAAHYSDVRYKLNLTLEKMSPVLKGTMEIRVRVSGEIESGVAQAETRPVGSVSTTPIILDWRKIKGSENLSTISNISINGLELSTTPAFGHPSSGRRGVAAATSPKPGGRFLSFAESNEHLIFRDGVVVGENVIKLDFTSPILTSGSAITRYVDKEDGAEYIYSLFVPSDASTAFPVFDQPDLKARFSLNIVAPIDWGVVTNGRMYHSNSNENSGPVSVEAAQKRAQQKYEVDKAKGFPHPFGGIEHSALTQYIPQAGFTWTFFNESEPISTYVFAFAAGPWERVSSPHVSKGTSRPNDNVAPSLTVGLLTPKTSIYVRKSQAAKFRPHADEVFRLNREGIKYLETYFDYKFPFPKYDIVLIPEFPFGGMEHAGATFLREDRVIFPQEPTKNDYITRANLIFHEAAHQWFGDTVTMKWFDDLWLKEGFAEFMAYKTLEKVMPEYNAWKIFYERNKQAAYLTDSTKGTTPIYQEIANLNAAKSAYGNIVYRKAPSFLRQAEFYIGPDKFQTAVRAFLKKHEYANAEWADLIEEFENSNSKKSQNVATWGRDWIEIRGAPTIWTDELLDNNDRKIGIRFSQKMNAESDWWNFDTLVLIRYADQKQKIRREEFVLNSNEYRYAELGDKRAPVFVFPNYQDYGYGIFLLDDKSREYVLKNIQNEKDDFLRTMMWGSLWDSVREAELDPKEYVELVVKNLSPRKEENHPVGEMPTPLLRKEGSQNTPNQGGESDESTIQTLLGRVSTAMTYYISEPPASAGGKDLSNENLRKRMGRDDSASGQPQTPGAVPPANAGGSDLRVRLENLLIDRMQNAPTLGQRITFYRAFLNIASTGNARKVLKQILIEGGSLTVREGLRSDAKEKPSLTVRPLPIKTKDRFDIVTKLLILNDPDAPKLFANLEKTETSDEAKRYAYAAKAGIATAENKAKFWSDFTTNKEISESWIEAAFGPFNSVKHADLTLPYLERALKELPNHKRSRKIFFVNGWLAAFIGGQRSEEALNIVNKFLVDNPNLDRDLRLKILENVDLIERAVKIRAKFSK